MKFIIHNFFKLSLLLISLCLLSCSKNFKENNTNLYFPKNIAKIEGYHAIFVKKNNFNLNENINSDDCESWALNLELEKLFVNSFLELSKRMFQNIKVIESEFNDSFLKNRNYNSILILEKNVAYVDFRTEGNKAKFTINLDSKFKVKGNMKEVNNNINSRQSWEKNIFISCYLPEGAKKATEEAFKNLISQAYTKIYDSILTVRK